MATNKHAMIRYQALDKCFSNWQRRFNIDALVDACNDALYQFAGIEDGVKKRQVYADINFMESEQGWSIPLEKYNEGRRVFYRYSEKSYTINNQPLTDSEISQLKEATFMLSRFKGMPSFEWIEELISRLEDKFHLVGNAASVIGFEQNQYLKGIEYISELFNAIIGKQCLKISYCNFKHDRMEWEIHPYYLKQYNTRWFLLGMNEEYQSISTIPLDRIESIELSLLKYRETDIDFEEYFDDVIGVTIPRDEEITAVQLRFSEKRFSYITSKPLHGSQRIIDKNNRIVEIFVIPNNELMALLLSYGKDVEVIAPQSVRDNYVGIVKEMYKINS